MPRYIRSQCAGGTFFFTLVTHRRKNIFLQDRTRNLLRSAIITVRKDDPFTIDAWVLLPDHMHCIWTLPNNDRNYSKRWSMIKRKVTQGLTGVRNEKREGDVWQRRFWEHQITDDQDYQAHMDYIHYNPVKHGLVNSVKQWPFSSFHRLVKLGVYPLDWGGIDKEGSDKNYGE